MAVQKLDIWPPFLRYLSVSKNVVNSAIMNPSELKLEVEALCFAAA